MEFDTSQLNEYARYLSVIGSLSRLFSESSTPYLDYRVTENLFCRAFNAKNISRSDTAYDAVIESIGVGIKTFIVNNNNFKTEKIAEFNKLSQDLQRLSGRPRDLALKLAEYRNTRIQLANDEIGITGAIYHCIGRAEGEIRLFNNDYRKIDLDTIREVSKTKNVLKFKDQYESYSFNLSKNTLYKVFKIPEIPIRVISVNIHSDPIGTLIQILPTITESFTTNLRKGIDFVVLPLYSVSKSNETGKVVAEKSGLNQWNAGGRERNLGECYIPIPSIIHKLYPTFFPPRDTKFKLSVPTGDIFNAKICQDNSKALMTDPNKDLSDWLLRKLLRLKTGEIATYDHLIVAGTDSVVVKKIGDKNYSIHTYSLDGYEKFISDEELYDIR